MNEKYIPHFGIINKSPIDQAHMWSHCFGPWYLDIKVLMVKSYIQQCWFTGQPWCSKVSHDVLCTLSSHVTDCYQRPLTLTMSEWYWRGSLPLAPPSRNEERILVGSNSFLRFLFSSEIASNIFLLAPNVVIPSSFKSWSVSVRNVCRSISCCWKMSVYFPNPSLLNSSGRSEPLNELFKLQPLLPVREEIQSM